VGVLELAGGQAGLEHLLALLVPGLAAGGLGNTAEEAQLIRMELKNFIRDSGNFLAKGANYARLTPGGKPGRLSLNISVLGEHHGTRGHHQTIGQFR
jgi:hypothetical protein